MAENLINSKPLVSILVSMYNTEKYVEEMIDSVLNQTFKDYEFIIVDDGSTDSSIEIVKKIKDPRIILIENKHDFIGSLNIGLKRAKGKYIARMDSDDIMEKDRIAFQVDFMENNPEIDVSIGWAKMFGNMEGIYKTPIEHDSFLYNMLLSNQAIQGSSMIKRSCFDSIKYKKGYLYAEDYKLWIDFIMAGYRFAGIPKVFIHYRRHESQATTNIRPMFQSSVKIQREYCQFVIETISSGNKAYYPFCEEIVEMFNKELIDYSTLFQIVHLLYRNVLRNSSSN